MTGRKRHKRNLPVQQKRKEKFNLPNGLRLLLFSTYRPSCCFSSLVPCRRFPPLFDAFFTFLEKNSISRLKSDDGANGY